MKNNLSADIKLFPFLSFKSSLGLDLTRTSDEGFSPKYYLSGTDQVAERKLNVALDKEIFGYLKIISRIMISLEIRLISAMAGTSAEKERYETVKASKEGFVNNDYSQQIINAGTKNPGASGSVSYHTMNSYFGRVFYSYADRYMITANVRWDGSSNFADNHRWGVFHPFQEDGISGKNLL